MRLIDMTRYNTVCCIGDIHGEFSPVVKRLCTKLSDTVVFCCGDIGMGFHKPGYYSQLFMNLDRKLANKNITMLLIRGNHDDPAYFSDIESCSPILAQLNNIKFVDDYSIVQTGIGNVLCVGGAISIDRTHRKPTPPRATYWEGENVIQIDDTHKAFISEHSVDYVCTHSSPHMAPPEQKYCGSWCIVDLFLPKDLDVERRRLTEIYEYLCSSGNKPKKWIYGHFHTSYDLDLDGTRFHCCDMYREHSQYGHDYVDIYTL